METKKLKMIIIVLGFLLLVMAGAVIFTAVSSQSRISALNSVISTEGKRHEEELRKASAAHFELQSSLDELSREYQDLKAQKLDTSDQFAETSRELDALRNRMMCPSTIPFVDYSDDGTVSAALKEYTSDYKATDDSYEAVQVGARITYHKLRSSRTESFFIVFFADGANGRVNGVFDVLGQCWVNLDNR